MDMTRERVLLPSPKAFWALADALAIPGGGFGDPLASLGGPWGSLGGLEASLGIAVSATNNFVIYTSCFMCVSAQGSTW